MKGGVFAFLGGVGIALAAAMFGSRNGWSARGIAAASGLSTLDLNSASAADLVALGIDSELADRVIENRPYRSKLELLERFVVGQAEYNNIKDRLSVDADHANDAVRVAS